jgi:putative addiction module antidote
MSEVKITSIGNSAGIILSKEILAKLRARKGDTLYMTETADGWLLRPYNAKLAKAMEIAESIMREERDILKKLADS